jgi:hypothetical protein
VDAFDGTSRSASARLMVGVMVVRPRSDHEIGRVSFEMKSEDVRQSGLVLTDPAVGYADARDVGPVEPEFGERTELLGTTDVGEPLLIHAIGICGATVSHGEHMHRRTAASKPGQQPAEHDGFIVRVRHDDHGALDLWTPRSSGREDVGPAERGGKRSRRSWHGALHAGQYPAGAAFTRPNGESFGAEAGMGAHMPPGSAFHPIDRVAIVLPARDECADIERSLSALGRAIRFAGPSVSCQVTVVDDGSADGTGRRARRAIDEIGLPATILRVDLACVGAARRVGVETATSEWVRPEHAWILSTDADSNVRPDWIARHVRHARRGVSAVAGVVDLFEDAHVESFRSQWRIDYGKPIDRLHRHPYAHATNLGIRLDAYRAVGGFRELAREEDADLWARLRRDQWEQVADARIIVDTSGRRLGRVAAGFAHALAAMYPEPRSLPETDRRRELGGIAPPPATVWTGGGVGSAVHAELCGGAGRNDESTRRME